MLPIIDRQARHPHQLPIIRSGKPQPFPLRPTDRAGVADALQVVFFRQRRPVEPPSLLDFEEMEFLLQLPHQSLQFGDVAAELEDRILDRRRAGLDFPPRQPADFIFQNDSDAWHFHSSRILPRRRSIFRPNRPSNSDTPRAMAR